MKLMLEWDGVLDEDLILQVHYQPKVNLKSNEIYGVEALARFSNSIG